MAPRLTCPMVGLVISVWIISVQMSGTVASTTAAPFSTSLVTATESTTGANVTNSTASPLTTLPFQSGSTITQFIDHTTGGVKVVNMDWEYVQYPVLFGLLMLVWIFVSILWRQIPGIMIWFPESCLLMTFGVILGTILSYVGVGNCGFPSQQFFFYILPPVVIDASYDLNHKLFAENVGSVLLFAIVGTIINFVIIGPTMYGMSYGGWFDWDKMTWTQAMYFGSFIVAVDPVAVLAIFSEVGVNECLFYNVFGEALLNDAVTVALFNGVEGIQYWENVPIKQWGLFVAYFFAASAGGFAIGVVIAVITAILIRWCKGNYVIEMLTVLIGAFFSNLVPLMISWSGIYGMFGCAITQAQFALPSLEPTTRKSLRMMVHLLGNVAENLVFILLGGQLVVNNFNFQIDFVWMAVIMCLIGRVFSVGILANVANIFRTRKFKWNEMIMMWWGGLRGGVAYALVTELPLDYPVKGQFVMSCLFVIFFTAWIMGMTTKPMLSILKVELSQAKLGVSMWKKSYLPVNDLVMSAVEGIVAGPVHNTGDALAKMRAYRARDKFFRPVFTKSSKRYAHDVDLLRVYDYDVEKMKHERDHNQKMYNERHPDILIRSSKEIEEYRRAMLAEKGLASMPMPDEPREGPGYYGLAPDYGPNDRADERYDGEVNPAFVDVEVEEASTKF